MGRQVVKRGDGKLKNGKREREWERGKLFYGKLSNKFLYI